MVSNEEKHESEQQQRPVVGLLLDVILVGCVLALGFMLGWDFKAAHFEAMNGIVPETNEHVILRTYDANGRLVRERGTIPLVASKGKKP